jgi:hypothetical protein
MIQADDLCGNSSERWCAQEFRTMVIDLFLAPYMPFGNGDRERTGVADGSGTFGDDGFSIYFLTIFRIVKKLN